MEIRHIDILPTHTCFDDVAEYVNECFFSFTNQQILNARICHGIMPDRYRPKKLICHCWLEIDNDVIDFGIIKGDKVRFVVDKKEYYAETRVKEVTRYTIGEVADTKTTGPFKLKYQKLCRDYNPKTKYETFEDLGITEIIRK